MKQWRVELHCHSVCSKKDGVLTPEQIITIAKRKKIDAIALTDHNEIEGAQELKRIAPEWLTVIVGEEVATKQGDIIGLFLKEKIAPYQDIRETIRQIKSRGGLVFVPHPLDRLRSNAVGAVALEAIKKEIDAVEVFNARNVFSADNQKAKRWAGENNIIPFVGSDAHFAKEFGKATCLVDEFIGKDTFRKSLSAGQFQFTKSSLVFHLLTKLVNHYKT